jgi:DNA-binding transcriptional MerR regulator
MRAGPSATAGSAESVSLDPDCESRGLRGVVDAQNMKLKQQYSSRDVAALTGLSARQLQWWDARRLLRPSVPSHKTAAGGFTERRYSPVDLFELVAMADLRRRGFSVQKIRAMLETLSRRFGVRLYDAITDGGPVQLLTDGREMYARTEGGQFFNLLRSPSQPLLAVGEEGTLKALNLRMRTRKKGKPKTGPKAGGRQAGNRRRPAT